MKMVCIIYFFSLQFTRNQKFHRVSIVIEKFSKHSSSCYEQDFLAYAVVIEQLR